MIESPCHVCDARSIGCHAYCEKYAEYRSAVEQRREKIARQKQDTNATVYKPAIREYMRKKGN